MISANQRTQGNKGRKGISLTYTITKHNFFQVTVPKRRTTYWCQAIKVSDVIKLNEKKHIIEVRTSQKWLKSIKHGQNQFNHGANRLTHVLKHGLTVGQILHRQKMIIGWQKIKDVSAKTRFLKTDCCLRLSSCSIPPLYS